MALGVKCSVINQLPLDFGAFTCKVLSSDFVTLLSSVRTQNAVAQLVEELRYKPAGRGFDIPMMSIFQ
jgi:hypothetical protein